MKRQSQPLYVPPAQPTPKRQSGPLPCSFELPVNFIRFGHFALSAERALQSVQ